MNETRTRIIRAYSGWTALSALRSGSPVKSRDQVYGLLKGVPFDRILEPADLPIDASGILPGGRSFRGPAGLKSILLDKKVQFARCMTEKLMTYALGRGLEPKDKCYVEEIVRSVVKNDYRFSSLVNGIVLSDPFRKRRVDKAGASTAGLSVLRTAVAGRPPAVRFIRAALVETRPKRNEDAR